MLPKESGVVYSTTKLTNYGKQLLLSQTNDFEITDFVLIDEETNYNYVNIDSNKLAKGFGKVNTDEEDDYSDILNQVIFDSLYKVEAPKNFLVGEYHNHNLLADKIKNEFDVIIDMQGGELNLNNSSKESNDAKKITFISEVLNGNLGKRILDENDIRSFSFFVDIRGTVQESVDQVVTTYNESSSSFTSFVYTVTFQSTESLEDNFILNQNVKANQPFVVSIPTIRKVLNKGINHYMYGTFQIYKTFIYNNVTYISDTITVELSKPAFESNDTEIITKADVGKIYELGLERRNLYASIPDYDDRKINAQVYNSEINNSLFKQQLNGYVSLKDNMKIDFQTSHANNFRLYIENIKNGDKYYIMSLFGDSADFGAEGLFTTIHNFKFSLTFIKHQSEKGISFTIIPEMPEQIGLIKLREVDLSSIDSNQRIFQYEVLDLNHVVQITIPKTLNLFMENEYDALQKDERLFALQCDEQPIIYNYDFTRNIYSNDYQNLIIDMLN